MDGDSDCLGDFILRPKDIAVVAFDHVGPGLAAILCPRELRRDAQFAASAPHRTLYDVLYVERLADGARVDVTLPAIAVRQVPRRDLHARNAAQRGRELVADAVGEVLLRRIAAD